MSLTKITFIAPLCVLAACSSNGTTGAGGGGGSQFRAFVTGTQDLLDRNGYESFGSFANYTDAAAIPRGGVATMDGYAALFLNGTPQGIDGAPATLPDPSHIGELSLEIRFGEDEGILTGAATNFYDSENDVPYGGALNFTQSRALTENANTANSPALTVQVIGTLSSPTGQDYSILGNAGGVFVGDTASGVAGVIQGRVTSDGDSNNFVGAYVAD